MLNDFRVSNAKTISMVHEQMDVRIYGNTAIMIIQLRSREQTPDGHAIEHLGRATLGDSFPRWSYRLWRTRMITTVCITLAWS